MEDPQALVRNILVETRYVLALAIPFLVHSATAEIQIKTPTVLTRWRFIFVQSEESQLSFGSFSLGYTEDTQTRECRPKQKGRFFFVFEKSIRKLH